MGAFASQQKHTKTTKRNTKNTLEHAPKSVHLWSLHQAVVGELPAATVHPFAEQRSKTRWQPRIQVEWGKLKLNLLLPSMLLTWNFATLRSIFFKLIWRIIMTIPLHLTSCSQTCSESFEGHYRDWHRLQNKSNSFLHPWSIVVRHLQVRIL